MSGTACMARDTTILGKRPRSTTPANAQASTIDNAGEVSNRGAGSISGSGTVNGVDVEMTATSGNLAVASVNAGGHAILRAPQTRRSDHLHRLGDLLRRLDGANPAAEVNE